MSSTAHDDQFTDAPEPVRQPYDTGSILRRNVVDLEIALKQQAERAEKAEAELARLREQKPALYMAFSDCGNFIRYWTRDTKNLEATMAVNDFEVLEFYAAPVPAVAAPAVPDDWRDVMAELAADLQASIEAEHAYRDQYSSVMRKYQNNMRIVERARALLQSAEVTK